MRIACPELTDDDRAALEARARAELSVAPVRDATVTIDCSVRWVSIEGHGAPLARHVAIDVSGAAFADELLDAVHVLLVEAGRADTPPNAVAAAPEEQGPSGAPGGALQRNSEDSQPTHRGSPFYRVGAAAGVDSELWSGAIGAAMGGHAGARLWTDTGWAAELDGGIVWGLASTHTIEARTVQATLRIDYAPVAILRIGLGADARFVTASASGPTSPTERGSWTLGAIAAARYALRVDRFEFLVGLQVEVIRGPVVVEFDGSEVMRIPTVLAGLSLEAAAGLTR